MPDGLIVAVGPNGEGKTNLLEGIHFLYALGSPRTSTNAPLVREGPTRPTRAGSSRPRTAGCWSRWRSPPRAPARSRSTARRFGASATSGARFVRCCSARSTCPIVIGDPSKRRTFMDEAVIALGRSRKASSRAYDRSLRQRNRLLKEWEGSGTPPGMEAWDEELIQAGSAVIQARAEAIDRLAPHASEEFVHLAGYELACTYAPNVWDAADLEEGLPRPHRGASPRRAAAAHVLGRAASRRPHAGRARPRREGRGLARRNVGHGAVSAAGLATAVTKELGEPPVFLVDDPFSALDPRAATRSVSTLRLAPGQVFISVADEADVPASATPCGTYTPAP